jgi:LL-diaminopimelate aminotransferase
MIRSEGIDDLIAERLGGRDFGKSTEIYKFARIKRAREEALKNYPDRMLIDMGVGEPDREADSLICEELKAQCGQKENRFYSDNGILPFQKAAKHFMERIYGVTGLKKENIIHGIGSKPILALLPLGFINPGDITLMTVPGYPVLGTHTQYLGGEVYPLPLKKKNRFFPDLESIPASVCKRAKLLYLNYPNNPTGKGPEEGFYRWAVDFALKNNILIVSDAAYAGLSYGTPPLSLLSIEGAIHCAVEIHSLSKSFNMTGWRLAFITGNEKAVQVYGTLKDNTDSGQFRAIQLAGCKALNNPALVKENRDRYSRRLDLLVERLSRAGFKAEKPQGSFYCYVPAPKGAGEKNHFHTASEAADYLIREAGIVTVPWDEAGAYLRFSVTYEAEDGKEEKIIMDELERRLSKLNLQF